MPSYPYPKLELKYCERCGGLWLRSQGSDAVYCAACADAVRQLPPSTRGGGSPFQAAHAVYVAVVAFLMTSARFAEQIGGLAG